MLIQLFRPVEFNGFGDGERRLEKLKLTNYFAPQNENIKDTKIKEIFKIIKIYYQYIYFNSK